MSLCTDKLAHVLQTTDGLKEDLISGTVSVGELATKAWGTGMKETCYKEMPTYEIYNFVKAFTVSDTEIIDETGANTASGTQSGTSLTDKLSSINVGSFMQSIGLKDVSFSEVPFTHYLSLAGWGLVGAVGLVLLYKIIQYLLVFLYDVLNAWRIVYIRVVLPRGDDKISREQAHDVAKDMKEKISRMGQMYDALHKL